MASPACCAAGPPVTADYSPKGTVSKVGDVDTYFIGSGPKSLLVVYDIFGFGPQVKQVCDILADAGFNVAMPDVCKGDVWSLETFPPKDMGDFMAWIGSTGDWETTIFPKLQDVISYMKESKGAHVFGVIGFCWGGKMSMQAASLGPESGVMATACVHPAMLTPELASEVKVPMLIMPAGNDPDHLPLKEVLDKKAFGDKCQFHRFDDMHHGFCAGRGDWEKPEQAARVSEAIGLLQKFFESNL